MDHYNHTGVFLQEIVDLVRNAYVMQNDEKACESIDHVGMYARNNRLSSLDIVGIFQGTTNPLPAALQKKAGKPVDVILSLFDKEGHFHLPAQKSARMIARMVYNNVVFSDTDTDSFKAVPVMSNGKRVSVYDFMTKDFINREGQELITHPLSVYSEAMVQTHGYRKYVELVTANNLDARFNNQERIAFSNLMHDLQNKKFLGFESAHPVMA